MAIVVDSNEPIVADSNEPIVVDSNEPIVVDSNEPIVRVEMEQKSATIDTEATFILSAYDPNPDPSLIRESVQKLFALNISPQTKLTLKVAGKRINIRLNYLLRHVWCRKDGRIGRVFGGLDGYKDLWSLVSKKHRAMFSLEARNLCAAIVKVVLDKRSLKIQKMLSPVIIGCVRAASERQEQAQSYSAEVDAAAHILAISSANGPERDQKLSQLCGTFMSSYEEYECGGLGVC